MKSTQTTPTTHIANRTLRVVSVSTLLFSSILNLSNGAPVFAAEINASQTPETSTVVPDTSPSDPEDVTSNPLPLEPVATPDVNEAIDTWMPNKKLQQIVFNSMQEENIDVQSVQDITKDKLAQLSKLQNTTNHYAHVDNLSDTPYSGNFSLEGVQYATNLTEISICGDLNYGDYVIRGDVTDISQIAGLHKLESINFSGNRIHDIRPILALQGNGVLKDVELGSNEIADFSGIDTSQYASFRYSAQVIILDPVYIDDTRQYTLTADKIKLPNNQPLEAALQKPELYSKAVSGVRASMSAAWIFYNGARGGSANNFEFTYTNIVPQEAAPSESPFPGVELLPLPNKNYLMMQLYFSGNNGDPSFQLVQPYTDQQLSVANVTVHHQDETGKKLADDVVLKGTIGADYQSEIAKIEGYQLKEVQGSEKGTFSNEAKEITYVYMKEVVPGDTVTAHYVDEAGNPIAKDEVLTGNIGESYEAEQKLITGYTFQSVQGNHQGTFTDQKQEVTFVYTKDILKAANVTAHYVDSNGKTIAKDEILTGNIGESYQTKEKKVTGYSLKKVQGAPTGTFSSKAQVITYIYQKDKPSGNNNNNQGSGNTGSGSNNGNNNQGSGNTGSGSNNGNNNQGSGNTGSGNNNGNGNQGSGNTGSGNNNGNNNQGSGNTGSGNNNGNGNQGSGNTGSGNNNGNNNQGSGNTGSGNNNGNNTSGSNSSKPNGKKPGTASHPNTNGSVSSIQKPGISNISQAPSNSSTIRNKPNETPNTARMADKSTLPSTGEKYSSGLLAAGIGIVLATLLPIIYRFKHRKNQRE